MSLEKNSIDGEVLVENEEVRIIRMAPAGRERFPQRLRKKKKKGRKMKKTIYVEEERMENMVEVINRLEYEICGLKMELYFLRNFIFK